MIEFCEEYKNVKAHNDLLELLSGAEEDVKSGRVAPAGKTFEDLRALLQEENLDTKIREKQ